MKIPNKKYNIKTAVKNNFYMLKLAMELCPGRVLCSGLVCLSGYFSWLFFSGFFFEKACFHAGGKQKLPGDFRIPGRDDRPVLFPEPV